MDTETSRIAQAKAELEAILDGPEYKNIPFRLAQDWVMNSVHFSRLFKDDILTGFLDDLLVGKGLLEKKPPKDPRPRVWMRTNDIDLAVATLFKHYRLQEILEAMTRHPDGRDIVSIEFQSGPTGLISAQLDAYYHDLNEKLAQARTLRNQSLTIE